MKKIIKKTIVNSKLNNLLINFKTYLQSNKKNKLKKMI